MILIGFAIMCYLISWRFFLWAFKNGLMKYGSIRTTRATRAAVLILAPFWLLTIVIYGIYIALRTKRFEIMTNEMHDAVITTPEGISLSLFELSLLALAADEISRQRSMTSIMDETVRIGAGGTLEAIEDDITPEWANLRDKLGSILDELAIGKTEE